MATPSAPQARAATRPRPSWKPPAPSTGIAWPTASTTWGSSRLVGMVPVWPPPSPPWAMTASTPQSSIFSAWRRAPTVGMTRMPASWRRPIASLVGAPAKLTSRTPSATQRSMRAARSGWSARRLTPNALSVRSLTVAMASAIWAPVMVTAARMPNPPAADVAAVSEAPETQPMPVCTTGRRQPTRSQNRVCSGPGSDGASDIGPTLISAPRSPPEHGVIAGLEDAAVGVDHLGHLGEHPRPDLGLHQPVVGVGLEQVDPLGGRVGLRPEDVAAHGRPEGEVGRRLVLVGRGQPAARGDDVLPG